MINPKILSLWVLGATFIIVVWQRSRLLDLTCTGVFFISYFIFVLAGLLIAPWLMENYIRRSFYFLKLYLISDRDLSMTILVVASGLCLVLLGHMCTDVWLYGKGQFRLKRQWGFFVRRHVRITLGVSRLRLMLFFIISLSLASMMLLSKWHMILNGIKLAYWGRDVAAFYDTRIEAAGIGYFYWILVCNVLPFLSIAFWMRYRFRINLTNRFWGLLTVGTTSMFSLLLFQKRPLVLYLLILLLAHGICEIYTGRWNIKLPNHFPTLRYWLFRIPWRKIIYGFSIPFALLVWFFWVSTSTRSFGAAALIAFNRIWSRLAIMPIIYVYYFPKIEPYYGLTNIGVLARLRGTRVYPDTRKVPTYFSFSPGREGAGGAIGALVDFYCAFGWVGFVFFCFGLGMFLNLLDRWLSSLPFTVINRTLYVFMFVFAYYLSQASVPRSLSSYGGGYFLLLWFLLSLRLKLPRWGDLTV